MRGKNEEESFKFFAQLLDHLLFLETGRDISGSEPLAEMEYDRELALKKEALREFWNLRRLPCDPPKIIPSPVARGYRSTTKRKASFLKGRLYLLHPGERPAPGRFVSDSLLEPDSHKTIFTLLHERLSRPQDRALSERLNWVIVRTGEKGLAVILNVFKLDALVVRRAKNLAEWLSAQSDEISSTFVFFDPLRSEYYLEAGGEPIGEGTVRTWRGRLRCLKGPRDLALRVRELKLRFPPVVFSQINQSMLPILLDSAKELLGIEESRPSAAHLIDLYCGYGLFSFGIGSYYARVTGLEMAGPAIEAARSNYKRMKEMRRVRPPMMKFIEGRIRPEVISRTFRQIKNAGDMIDVILDPPRRGTDRGVVEAIASGSPSRILHIFCGIDQVPIELRRWKLAGYRAERITCLDLFPGTAALEVLVALC